MARYIDADALLSKLPNDLPYKASVKRILMQSPTADVVSRAELENTKSEIERLTVELAAMRGAANSYKMHYENVKIEAIKEFAEKLKKYYSHVEKSVGALIEYTIDQKAKEMLEGE